MQPVWQGNTLLWRDNGAGLLLPAWAQDPCTCCGCILSADFSWAADPYDCRTIDFTNLTEIAGGCECTYEWDFGDGSETSSEQHPSHTYECAATSFDVTLTVTCGDGQQTVVEKTVTVCACEEFTCEDHCFTPGTSIGVTMSGWGTSTVTCGTCGDYTADYTPLNDSFELPFLELSGGGYIYELRLDHPSPADIIEQCSDPGLFLFEGCLNRPEIGDFSCRYPALFYVQRIIIPIQCEGEGTAVWTANTGLVLLNAFLWAPGTTLPDDCADIVAYQQWGGLIVHAEQSQPIQDWCEGTPFGPFAATMGGGNFPQDNQSVTFTVERLS